MKPQVTSALLAATLTFSAPSLLAELVTDDFSSDELSNEELLSLSLEEVMTLEVTSVSRKKQRLMDSAAAVYVVTQEDIRRSGAKTIPDALRMVPGVQVAQMNSNTWSISARGFNYVFANKLLVMMDGRTLYTPEFGGVNWDVQDTLMEDIDRIEVIRGPGAALWGANAVNGVINIITKAANETQGSLLTLGAGSEEKLYGSFRHGGHLSEGAHYRAFFKTFKRDGLANSDGSDAEDDWEISRAGFRVDWEKDSENQITLDGAVFDGKTRSPLFIFDRDIPAKVMLTDKVKTQRGAHLIGSWQRSTSDKGDFTLKGYYDHYKNTDYRISADRDTIDLETQHRYQWLENQELIWGLGYRSSWYNLSNMNYVVVDTEKSVERLYSAFIQDEIELSPDWHLTLSSRLEHHTSTGYEFQPNASVAWKVNDQTTAWAKISRAVRTPSISERRAEVDGVYMVDTPPLPNNTYLRINRNPELEAEKLTAFEFGVRRRVNGSLSVDVATFINRYKDLHSLANSVSCPASAPINGGGLCQPAIPTYFLLPVGLTNGLDAITYGLEVVMDWDVLDWWRIKTDVAWLQVDASRRDELEYSRQTEALVESLSAEYTGNLRSMMDLPNNWSFDTWIRYMGENRSAGTDAYTSLDIRLAHKFNEELELSLIGKNLFDPTRLEFNENFTGISATEVQESWYAQIQWNF
ncbi:TonB-dependent receptor plug domain-containing protein [Endozoicomonas elysicola]|uniref:TonB-dependent receptor plug domain-containing protein n=1 Tax=Endozoicomonas elysicola TaxID=305900 RepID=UPI00036E335D|nr:TonB-dependent receptor [Endozoicomonas elysicola]